MGCWLLQPMHFLVLIFIVLLFFSYRIYSSCFFQLYSAFSLASFLSARSSNSRFSTNNLSSSNRCKFNFNLFLEDDVDPHCEPLAESRLHATWCFCVFLHESQQVMVYYGSSNSYINEVAPGGTNITSSSSG